MDLMPDSIWNLQEYCWQRRNIGEQKWWSWRNSSCEWLWWFLYCQPGRSWETGCCGRWIYTVGWKVLYDAISSFWWRRFCCKWESRNTEVLKFGRTGCFRSIEPADKIAGSKENLLFYSDSEKSYNYLLHKNGNL